jgi:hypothetical protein
MGVTLTLLTMLGVPSPQTSGGDADACMDAFLTAVRRRERRRLAVCFGATGRVQHLDTGERPYQRATIDCRRTRDLEELLFGDDGFRDYVMMGGRRPWHRKNNLIYVPPYPTGDPVHVRWRHENDRLVIEELAMPSG